ncbi:MAG: xanthine dehydrogenase family protein molybdopterin-binding subunit [Gammaproteobacteria bacterium]|nr:xanthine dehydrogenase family protein molybdopterin-binding subunit [Gammaproteobacteria bacterium]
MPAKDALNVIGTRQPRLDGPEKCSGKSIFGDDVVLPGMLCGKILRSSHAHARILSIDTSKAEALPGVKAVITAADSEGIMGTRRGQEPVFCKDITTYKGEEIAAVAALDEVTAEKALRLIEVEYEELPSVENMRRARIKGAPQVHPDKPGNIWSDVVDTYGEPDEAFAEADLIYEEKLNASVTHNLFAEFHVAVVDFSLPDKLTLWTPTQTALLMQHALAPAFGLSISQVQIIHLNTGGAFSGRGGTRPHHYIAALLSRETRRPVKIFAAGDEEFLVCRALGENHYKIRAAVNKDGTLKAFDMDADMDGGAFPAEVGYFGWMAGLCNSWVFPLKGNRLRRRVVMTNTRPHFLGHGGMMLSTNSAIMQLCSKIAKSLDRDPIDFLLQNAIDPGHKGLSGEVFASCGLKECLETVRRESGWEDKYGKLPEYHGIGVGIGAMAAGAKGAFKHDTSAALVKIGEDGFVTVFTGIPDMGQGTHTTMAMIAAEVLGIDANHVQMVAGDTDITPIDIGAFAQRGTIQTGNAVRNAALDARDQLAKNAASLLETSEDNLIFKAGKIFVADAPEKSLDFAKVVYGTLHNDEGRYTMGRGFYNSPLEFKTTSWSFGAQVAEVSIDPEIGQVTVHRVTVAHDLGRTINPLACEGQIDGQVYSAMSQILYEEVLSDDGLYLNPSRLEYKMPRTYEMPEITHHLIETIDPYGPFGAKEIGEGPIVTAGGAIASAVSDALGGMYMHQVPMTPMRILRAIKVKEYLEAAEAAA